MENGENVKIDMGCNCIICSHKCGYKKVVGHLSLGLNVWVVQVEEWCRKCRLFAKPDLRSLYCRASLESQKSLLHVGDPLES